MTSTTNGTVLTDELITACLVNLEMGPPVRLPPGWKAFARSIEREVLAAQQPQATEPVGADLDGGKFVGVTTLKEGTHCAVILLPHKAGKRLEWSAAMNWAKEAGGQLPTRPVAALLYANAKDQFERTWYWTSDELQADTGDEDDASYAWFCYFYYGYQNHYHKGAVGACVAVRRVFPSVL